MVLRRGALLLLAAAVVFLAFRLRTRPSRPLPESPSPSSIESAPPARKPAPPASPPPPVKTVVEPAFREKILDELRAVYFGRPPDLRPILKARPAEAAEILLAFVEHPGEPEAARDRAMNLLYCLEVPGVDQKILGLVADGIGTSQMILTLGRRGVPGSGDALLHLYEISLRDRENVLKALTSMGDARGLPLIERERQEFEKGWPEREIRLRQAGVEHAELPDLKAHCEEGYDRLSRLIGIATSPDPETSAVPLLFENDFATREWAFHFLMRRKPPTLALHLRSAFDVQKGRSRWKRYDEQRYESLMLKALEDLGGPLTPDEVAFLDRWENAKG